MSRFCAGDWQEQDRGAGSGHSGSNGPGPPGRQVLRPAQSDQVSVLCRSDIQDALSRPPRPDL